MEHDQRISEGGDPDASKKVRACTPAHTMPRAVVALTTLGLLGGASGFGTAGLGSRAPVPAPPLRRLAVTAPRAPAVRADFGGPQFKLDAQDGEVAQVPFEIRFSLGNVVSASGGALFIFCILKFLLNNGESDVVSTFGFVYAIPALVGGLALKCAAPPHLTMASPSARPRPRPDLLRPHRFRTISGTPSCRR